jgi:hypothetical protein
MNARNLTRLTNAGMLAGVGMGAGHLAMPARATAGIVAKVVFVGTMAATGALAGWRERRGRELDGDEDVPGAEFLWVAGGALVTLGITWLAYRLAHG